MKRIVYKVEGMHCTSCAMSIEWSLEDLGVEKCACSYAKSCVEIEYEPDKITQEKLKEAIVRAGYSVSGDFAPAGL